jgi:hypothetical protein
MESQHPSAPVSATHANRSQQPPQLPPNTTSDEYEYTYNEKDAYSQQQNRRDRGSKTSSNGRGHDSVISHPFSPKPSYPPSPGSSISSAGGQRHHSITEIHSSALKNDGHNIRIPPQAHLDPEKHGNRSSHEHRSQRHSETHDVVYDQSKYHENEPEEKAWQLLVSTLLG